MIAQRGNQRGKPRDWLAQDSEKARRLLSHSWRRGLLSSISEQLMELSKEWEKKESGQGLQVCVRCRNDNGSAGRIWRSSVEIGYLHNLEKQTDKEMASQIVGREVI